MKKILTLILVVLSGIIPYGNTATVNAANLATLISNALSGKVYGDTVTVTLDAGIAYELESVAAAGLVNLIINGNGATVTLGKNGQLTAQQSLILNGINFNCANGTKELVALDGNPSDVLYCDQEPWKTMYVANTNSKKNYFNEGTIAFNNCKVASLKKSLFGVVSNKKNWALKELIIDGSIIQLDYASQTPAVISMEGCNGTNVIKDILIQNSTFYNIKVNNQYFLRYNNSSGANHTKVYTSSTKPTWKMFNNTFALNGNGSAKFGNNYTSLSSCTLTWKNNVFFKTDQLNKAKGNCTLASTKTDNALEGNGNSGDISAYGTMDNTCISIPTGAFDFDASKLLDAFCLYKNSYAYKNSMGDPRWLTKSKEFKKTVSARKLATMCWPYAVKIPTNVKAYIATQNGVNAVNLVKLTEGQIPANTGVIVYSDVTAATTYEFEPTKYSGKQDLSANCLKGVVKETLYSDVEVTGKTNYALMPPATDDGSSLEFRPVTSGSYAANTAYLQLSSSASKISFNFDDEATGVQLINDNDNYNDNLIYNLQGVRVNENYKGIVIVNGKKYLKK